MPNGGCIRCHRAILQGLRPHYCEECLKELGLEYDEETKKALAKYKKMRGE
jgi:hypothetical protein